MRALMSLPVTTLGLLLFTFTSVPAQQPPDLSGTYSNGQLTVVLERSGSGYTGRLDAAGNVTELSGTQGPDGVLSGSYDFQGQTWQFRAGVVPDVEGLVFQAEGREFVLQRTGDATATGPEPPDARARPDDPSPEPEAGDSDGVRPETEDPDEAPPPDGDGTGAPSDEVGDPSGGTAPGQVAEVVRNEEWGLELPVPEGWIGREVQGGAAYLLGWQDRVGFVLVLPLRAPRLERLRTEMRQGLREGGGTALRPTGSVEAFGDDGLAADFEGTLEGEAVRAHVASRISPHGRGASVLVAAEPDAFDAEHREAARELARSLGFFQPVVPPEVLEWRERLRGRVLTQYDSYSSGGGGGGYTSRTEIDLCVAGHFHFSGNHQASFNTTEPTSGYVMGERGGAGAWEVVARGGEPALRLEFHGGEVWEYALGWGSEIPASSARYTSLDGSDYLRTPSEKLGCGG